MDPVAPINAVSAAIQLAIAPVFLLTGIGAILAMLLLVVALLCLLLEVSISTKKMLQGVAELIVDDEVR